MVKYQSGERKCLLSLWLNPQTLRKDMKLHEAEESTATRFRTISREAEKSPHRGENHFSSYQLIRIYQYLVEYMGRYVEIPENH